MTKTTNKQESERIFYASSILELYRSIKKCPASVITSLVNYTHLLGWLYDNYEILHTQDNLYVIEEIDEILAQG